MSGFDADTDGKFSRLQAGLQQSSAGDLHECDHARGCEDRREFILEVKRERAGKIIMGDDQFGSCGRIDFWFVHDSSFKWCAITARLTIRRGRRAVQSYLTDD